MATPNQDQTMLAAHKRARADIASLTDWLELELDKQADREVTWPTVGTLGHVRENLIETLASLSGVDTSDIQRSLDELHS